jgi:hypothetical protein
MWIGFMCQKKERPVDRSYENVGKNWFSLKGKEFFIDGEILIMIHSTDSRLSLL